MVSCALSNDCLFSLVELARRNRFDEIGVPQDDGVVVVVAVI